MTINQASDVTLSRVGNDPMEGPLVLNPHLRVVHNDDEILVKHGTRSPYSEVIRDEAKTRLVGRILRRFLTPASLADLRQQGVITDNDIPSATDLVRHLVDRGILVDPATDPAQVYLDTIFGTPASGGGRLRTAVVGLVGCGQLGSRIASELALLRPGGLVLLDPRPMPKQGWHHLCHGCGGAGGHLGAAVPD